MLSLKTRLENHSKALNDAVAAHESDLQSLAKKMADCFSRGSRVFFFGNGGSACDAMHIAGEFAGRFVNDRKALGAIALTADSGLITAVANDYNYDYIFARQIEALCHKGDIAIGMSTSGASKNVLSALEAARNLGAYSVLFTGEKARGTPQPHDLTVMVPSRVTAHIQEVHMFMLHSLAALTESAMGIGE